MQTWKLRHCQILSFLFSPHPCPIISASFSVSRRYNVTLHLCSTRDLLDANVVMGGSQKRRKQSASSTSAGKQSHKTGLEAGVLVGGFGEEAGRTKAGWDGREQESPWDEWGLTRATGWAQWVWWRRGAVVLRG